MLSYSQQGRLFQSTPPCGGDGDIVFIKQQPEVISIHAPMRGRRKRNGPFPCQVDFNPRPHAGATLLGWKHVVMLWHFNPRPHAGATAIFFYSRYPLQYFNPRPHAGATTNSAVLFHALHDFNPRPHAGATFPQLHNSLNSVFQSTPPCGGDKQRRGSSPPPIISIHAPMRGRPLLFRMSRGRYDFNPRPHAGATGQFPQGHSLITISIHAPMRGRRHIRITCLPYADFNPRPHAGATWH